MNNRPKPLDNTRLQFLRKKPGKTSRGMERYFIMGSEHASEQGLKIAILCVVTGQVRDKFYDA
jgi:hypothetical protein